MNGIHHPSSPSLAEVLDRWEAVVARWDLDHAGHDGLLGHVECGPVAEIGSYGHEAAEARMRLLVEFAAVLDRALGEERRTRFWLRAPNAFLGRATPIDLMSSSPEWIRWLTCSVGVVS